MNDTGEREQPADELQFVDLVPYRFHPAVRGLLAAALADAAGVDRALEGYIDVRERHLLGFLRGRRPLALVGVELIGRDTARVLLLETAEPAGDTELGAELLGRVMARFGLVRLAVTISASRSWAGNRPMLTRGDSSASWRRPEWPMTCEPLPALHPAWQAALDREFDQPYLCALRGFLHDAARRQQAIRPAFDEIFAAFNATPLPEVRVVIIGQDPYHGQDQAEGLSFSVRKGVAIPPSLANIFREVQADMTDPAVPGGRPGGTLGEHGSLRGWARQGVLLLNAVLTTELGRAGAHRGRGWERFTDRVVEVVDRAQHNVVFLLWGNDAQKKGAGVDRTRHAVFTAPHPSPLSAYRGFLGCRHFSRANHYLVEHGRPPIDWFRTG